jgi:hypothetical protein
MKMSENIKITGIALDINDKTIYISLDEARELFQPLSALFDKKDDKENKIVYVPYTPNQPSDDWEVTYGCQGSTYKSIYDPDKYYKIDLSGRTYT